MVAEKNEATLWHMQDIFHNLARDNSAFNSDVHTCLAYASNLATRARGI